MTFGSVFRSELTKMISLRSTRWTLLALVVATVGFGALISWGTAQGYASASISDQLTFDPVANSLAGLAFGQLAIAVLGVLTISSEYGNGAIRGTFTAVPRRGLVLAAKASLVASAGLIFGLISAFAVFFISQPIDSHYGFHISLSHGSTVRAVIGGGLYLAASGLFGFAVGAALRRTAGAIVVAVASLLVVPGLTGLLPGAWGKAVHRYFTSNAGQQISFTVHQTNALGPWSGFLVYCAWWAVILAIAYLLVQHRDA
jgi:ABC-type transport system involved in multi-copper enzyme maturation permease subunit